MKAVGQALSRRREGRRKKTQRLKGQLDSRWNSVNGLRLYARFCVELAGAEAPAVVLVHGLGVSSRYLIPTGELLAPEYRVFAPDLPGWGKSARPPQTLTIPELADALVAWMDVVGLERPHMIGNSLGCQIIVELAVRYPHRLERAVLIGPTMDRKARQAWRQAWRVVLDSFQESWSQPIVVLWDYLIMGPRRFWQTLQHGLADPIEKKLPHMPHPALVVRGADDQIVPQPWAEEVAGLLPCGRLVTLPDAPHTVNYSTPDKLMTVVRPFFGAAKDENSHAAVSTEQGIGRLPSNTSRGATETGGAIIFPPDGVE